MTTQVAQTPWDVAVNPPPPPSQSQDFFGELALDAQFVALVKGVGKVPWEDDMENQLDPQTGKNLRRYTALRVTLFPLAEMNLKWEVEREMLAEFGAWVDVVLPSLKAIGVMDLPSINGKWAHLEMVENGESYINRDGKNVNKTYPKFHAIYQTEDACRAAYMAYQNGTTPPAAQAAAPAPANTNGEQDVALTFLKQYVANAVKATPGDLQAIRNSLSATIAGQALLQKYFTVDSPEVVQAIAAQMG